MGRGDARQLRLASRAPGFTNPTPKQEDFLLNFHWSWLNERPVLWTTVIVIVLIGAVYFVLVQRNKPAHLQAPEGEALADEMATAPATAT